MTRIWSTIAQAIAYAPRTARYPFGWDPSTHLLSRFNFGPSPDKRAFLSAHGPDAFFAAELAGGRALSGYRGSAAVAAQGPLLSQSPAQVQAWLTAHGNTYGWDAMTQLLHVTLGLQIWSRAQLYETVVDFFANHLNVPNFNSDVWTTRHTFDRDVIRQYALGSYTDMLLASARNPAMLRYLSLYASKKTAINENYGRELLELHTVGLDAGYTEDDVKNVARILTGRTFDSASNYTYRADWHWTGPIQVLGFSHANDSRNDGEAGGDALLRYLAAHPSTAQRLARKLCIRYVSDTPSAGLVAAVAAAYLANGTQIVPMLQTIVRSEEFWSSRGAKVRRPAENIVATMRAVGMPYGNLPRSLTVLQWMTQTVGHVPLGWTAPNGYPDTADAWRSSGSLVNLWTYHRGLSQNWFSGLGVVHVESWLGPRPPRTAGEALDQLTRRLTGATWSPAHRAEMQAFLGQSLNTPYAKSKLRQYLTHVIAVILDSPEFSLR